MYDYYIFLLGTEYSFFMYEEFRILRFSYE